MYKINACVDDISLDQNSICSKCEKQVYDIRNLSKSEINHLVKSSNGSICAIAPANKFNAKYYLHPFRRFAFAMLLVFGSSAFVMGNDVEQSILKIQNELFQNHNVIEENSSISGKVSDETGNPIAAASVKLFYKGKVIGSTKSSIDGEYFLKYPEGKYKKGLTLIVSTVEFEGKSETILEIKPNLVRNIILKNAEMNRMVIGEYQKLD